MLLQMRAITRVPPTIGYILFHSYYNFHCVQKKNVNSNFPSLQASLELEEFTLVNRDLYLWCDALEEESQLQIDVFLCTTETTSLSSSFNSYSPPQHTLLERWTLRGNPLAPSFAKASPYSPLPKKQEERGGNKENEEKDDTEQLSFFGKYFSAMMDNSNETSGAAKLDLHDSVNEETGAKLELSESTESEGTDGIPLHYLPFIQY